MPIERDPIISIRSEQWRPRPGSDGLGNPTPGTTETKVADCTSGVIPQSIRRDPFVAVAGSNTNLLRWLVVVRGAPTLTAGDSIHVLSGKFAGRYRAEIVQTVPNETLILAQCLKES